MPFIPSDDINKRTDLWMMEDGFDSSVKEEPKNQFFAREGTYKLVTHADYSRGSRVGYNNPISSNIPVKVSFLKRQQNSSLTEKICFNHGRELFVYEFKGATKLSAGDTASKPLYQRPYKSFSPTCHDFCPSTSNAGESCPLLVGFSGGQVQLLDPLRKDVDRVFNDEPAVDRSKVTCVSWIPGDTHQFVASHTSGCIYVYNSRLPATHSSAPVFHSVAGGPGFSVHAARSRGGTGAAGCHGAAAVGRNPQQRWSVGTCAINRLAFSPCGQRLAVVGQDGWLHVFDWHAQRVLGAARSYFGALTCVAWSPDGRYVAVGGEDDLVTVWSLQERRVAVRGRGHKSWLADVAFDPVMSTMPGGDASGLYAPEVNYRLGSVGQDTQLCLWDLSADILRPPPPHKHRASLVPLPSSSPPLSLPSDPPESTTTTTSSTLSAVSARLWPLRLSNTSVRRQTMGPKQASGPVNGSDTGISGGSGAHEVVGTASCPRLTDCPLVEPHVACAVSAERLTAIVFLADCLLTGCADGYICTWARPSPSSGGGCSSVCSNTNGTVV